MHYMEDVYELTMAMFGFDPDNDEDFETATDKLEDLIYEKYEIDEENFANIIRDLVKFTPIVETALLNKKVQGFVNHKKGVFLYKEEVKPNK